MSELSSYNSRSPPMLSYPSLPTTSNQKVPLFLPSPDSALHAVVETQLERETRIYEEGEAHAREAFFADLKAQNELRASIEINGRSKRARETEDDSNQPDASDTEGARNGSGMKPVSEEELARFRQETRRDKRGTKKEKSEWPELMTLSCEQCDAANVVCKKTGTAACQRCTSSRLGCSRVAAFTKWRVSRALGITVERFHYLKSLEKGKGTEKEDGREAAAKKRRISVSRSPSKRLKISIPGKASSTARAKGGNQSTIRTATVLDGNVGGRVSHEPDGAFGIGANTTAHSVVVPEQVDEEEVQVDEEEVQVEEPGEAQVGSPRSNGSYDPLSPTHKEREDAFRREFQDYVADQRALALAREMVVASQFRQIWDSVTAALRYPPEQARVYINDARETAIDCREEALRQAELHVTVPEIPRLESRVEWRTRRREEILQKLRTADLLDKNPI